MKKYKKRPDILIKYIDKIIKLEDIIELKNNIYLEKNNIIILLKKEKFVINIVELNNKLYWKLYHNFKRKLFPLSTISFINIMKTIKKYTYEEEK